VVSTLRHDFRQLWQFSVLFSDHEGIRVQTGCSVLSRLKHEKTTVYARFRGQNGAYGCNQRRPTPRLLGSWTAKVLVVVSHTDLTRNPENADAPGYITTNQQWMIKTERWRHPPAPPLSCRRDQASSPLRLLLPAVHTPSCFPDIAGRLQH